MQTPPDTTVACHCGSCGYVVGSRTRICPECGKSAEATSDPAARKYVVILRLLSFAIALLFVLPLGRTVGRLLRQLFPPANPSGSPVQHYVVANPLRWDTNALLLHGDIGVLGLLGLLLFFFALRWGSRHHPKHSRFPVAVALVLGASAVLNYLVMPMLFLFLGV